MPIYEYRCRACEHTLEAIQKVSAAPLVECPACGADALQKQVSAPNFRLKGGGWYETDFKTGNKKNLAAEGQGSSDTPAADGGATKAPAAGDTTPDKPAKPSPGTSDAA